MVSVKRSLLCVHLASMHTLSAVLIICQFVNVILQLLKSSAVHKALSCASSIIARWWLIDLIYLSSTSATCTSVCVLSRTCWWWTFNYCGCRLLLKWWGIVSWMLSESTASWIDGWCQGCDLGRGISALRCSWGVPTCHFDKNYQRPGLRKLTSRSLMPKNNLQPNLAGHNNKMNQFNRCC